MLSTSSEEVGFKTSELPETKLRVDNLNLSLSLWFFLNLWSSTRATDTNQVSVIGQCQFKPQVQTSASDFPYFSKPEKMESLVPCIAILYNIRGIEHRSMKLNVFIWMNLQLTSKKMWSIQYAPECTFCCINSDSTIFLPSELFQF